MLTFLLIITPKARVILVVFRGKHRKNDANLSPIFTLNHTESKWRSVYSGVPQGSVKGPILFLIYVNDLPDYVKSSCKIFVDDTKIYAKVGNMADVEKIQKGIDELVEWSRTWLLNFNAGKCKVMQEMERQIILWKV